MAAGLNTQQIPLVKIPDKFLKIAIILSWYNLKVLFQVIHRAFNCPGGGVLPKELGRGVRPASQNPYPIYDQNLRFSIPYL